MLRTMLMVLMVLMTLVGPFVWPANALDVGCTLDGLESSSLESLRSAWNGSLTAAGILWEGTASGRGCSWEGVGCVQNSNSSSFDCGVSSIDLAGVVLPTGLPTELSRNGFPNLESVNLSGCQLTGPIPQPLQLSFSSLRHLDLSRNHLSGNLSADVCSIDAFSVAGNAFSCPLPACCSPSDCGTCTPTGSSGLAWTWRQVAAVGGVFGVIFFVMRPLEFRS